MKTRHLIGSAAMIGLGLLSISCAVAATPIPVETSVPPTPQPTAAPQTMTIILYFNWGDMSDCTATAPVERAVPLSADVAKTALEQLFSGPTEDERTAGHDSWFSAATADILISLRIDGDTAYLNLKDIRPIIPNAGTSCGSQMLLSQIEKTLQSNAPVVKVVYAIEGDPEAFYEWVQIGCDETINNCDPAPFANP